jgi:hypothetical protein
VRFDKRLSLVLVTLGTACTTPPSTEQSTTDHPEWEAQSVTESGHSTHLWLVERALDILSLHEGLPEAKATRQLMLAPECTPRWQQGLFDADFRHEYNGGSTDVSPDSSYLALFFAGTSWKSHFFDADTGLNYKGDADPTAYTETLRHLAAARAQAASDEGAACYELGLSLHFITDLTQPMHAANFTSLSRPLRLHSNHEEWSMEIQDGFRLADWSGPPPADAGVFATETARESKRMWAHSFEVIADAYEAHPNRAICGSLRVPGSAMSAQHFDRAECWNGSSQVREDVGRSLQRAQDITAQFLYIVAGLKSGGADDSTL